MSWRLVRSAAAGLAIVCNSIASVQAQTALQIPLNFNPDRSRLIINVGIGGGTPLPYLFDTGSALFNTTYNPRAWGTVGAASPNAVPRSTVANGNGVEYGYVSGGKYFGNILQVQNLSFAAASGGAAVASLAAPVGFQLNAIYKHTLPGGKEQEFPNYFNDSKTRDIPPIEGTFYGTFGAGNFVSSTNTKYVSGGILGQTNLAGLTPGYVVAANGQANVASNRPTSGTQQVTSCSPCVILGLTPALIGQFANVYQVTPSNLAFPNPYGSTRGNGSAESFGGRLLVTLTPPGGSSSQAVALTVGGAGGLLDTGTTSFILNTASLASLPASLGTIVTKDSKTFLEVKGGSTLGVSGVTSSGTVLPASTSTLVGSSAPHSLIYSADVGTNKNSTTDTYTSTIGLSFFLQNSVLYDLQNNVIGYTPFFVTSNDISTATGPLTVNSSSVPIGLAGVVSGGGGIAVGSGGALQLSAFNTFTGPTTIAAGGILLVTGPGSIAQSSGVTNNGSFDISGAWLPVSIQGLNGSGTVSLGGQTLVIQGNGNYSGGLSDGGTYGGGGGSVNIVSGTQVFGGAGTYTGLTTVSGGSLVVNGSLASTVLVGSQGTLTVNGSIGADLVNGGTTTIGGTVGGSAFNTGVLAVNGIVNGGVVNMGVLGGSGRIGGNLINNGVVGPGNSIGTLSITGSFTNTSSGVYSAEVNAAGQSDLINVGGTATLQGGSVSVYAQPSSTFAPHTTWRIVNAAGGLSGTFASINELYPFLQSSLSYDANNVYLTLDIGGFAAAAATPTQAAVGNVLDANVNTATGDFAQVLSAMATGTLSNAQAQATLQALSGNNYAGFSTSMVQGAQLFMNNFANQTGGGGSPVSNRVALAEACDVACDATTAPKWGAWGGALGGLGTVGANQPVGSLTYNAGGFAAGLDRSITDTFRMGVTAGYTTGTQWVSGFDGMGRTDTFQVGLYGGFAQDKVYADGLIGYAYSWNQMWRNIAIPGLPLRTAQGRTGANQWYGQLETGYRLDLGTNANAFVTPFARLQAYTGTQNGFSETGAQSLNLTVAQQTTNSLRSVIGAQIGGSMDLGWREKLAMQLRLGWSHEYADTARPVSATLAGAPAMPFTTFGVSPQRDGVVLGLSANTAIAEATSIYLRYEGDISGQDSAHAITAGVRMTW